MKKVLSYVMIYQTSNVLANSDDQTEAKMEMIQQAPQCTPSAEQRLAFYPLIMSP